VEDKMSNLPKYEDIPVKTYSIVHFNFPKNAYEVYQYESKRKISINRMWQIVYKSNAIYTGSARNIGDFKKILEKHNIEDTRPEMLMTIC
jgi:hypothetical protein